MLLKLLYYVSLSFFSFILGIFLDRGHQYDGNIRNDIPSTIGLIVSILILFYFILSNIFNNYQHLTLQ